MKKMCRTWRRSSCAALAVASLGASLAVSLPAMAGETAAVRDYRPVFERCRQADGAERLVIRRMRVDDEERLLTVDPATLATSLEPAGPWSCSATSDAAEATTRYARAIAAADAVPPEDAVGPVENAGLRRGAGEGVFVTGDLCPSRKPLDRDFFEGLRSPAGPTPIALSISGLWLKRHAADFHWLRDGERAGDWAITWVDHSYTHPYRRGLPNGENFLLTPGVDARAEMLGTERLLIESGATPSVFFRFPGLVSNAETMRVVRDLHLVTLGAEFWAERLPKTRPGSILLVHPNGNEPEGLRLFATLLASHALPQPFRPIAAAP